jgi:hypothetical protein
MSMGILNLNECASFNFLTQSLKLKAKSHSVKFKALNFELWFCTLRFTLFAILVSLCFLNCPAAQAAFEAGDVSGDGEVSAYDAALVAQASVELITLVLDQTRAAEVSGDGQISAYDAALIAQKSVGLIDEFPSDGNLVVNPGIEYDVDGNGIPDGWKTYANDSQSHLLYWVDDPVSGGTHGKVLKAEYTGTGTPDTFGWTQDIYLIKPDTWYEFSADIAGDGIEPVWDKQNPLEISTSSVYTGIYVVARNSSGYSIDMKPGAKAFLHGPNMSGWDDNVKVYRTYTASGFDGWSNVKTYFRTTRNTKSIQIKTLSFPKSKVYVDNVSVKEVNDNRDPRIPLLNRSGWIEFIQYKGKDFFPIMLFGLPTETFGGASIGLDEVKQAGFNSLLVSDSYNGMGIDKLKSLLIEKDLAAVIWTGGIVSHGDNTNYWLNDYWVNDHLSNVNYMGWQVYKTAVDKWAGFDNFFGVNMNDEKDWNPGNYGAFFPKVDGNKALKDYLHEKDPDAYLISNYCGVTSTGIPSYTGDVNDFLDYFAPNDDLMSATANLNCAYYINDLEPALKYIGDSTARMINITKQAGLNRPYLAFGVGVHEWSNWDGTMVGTNYNDSAHLKRYLPFNLQRFQVWDQIINGATGVWFWGTYHIVKTDPYYNHHYNQIRRISVELASLYNVLLEPDFYGGWRVSDESIHIMMKKHNGKIYLFSASASPEDINNATISLDPQYKIISVKVLNDIINGDIYNPINRMIIPNSSNSFVDDFIGDSNAAPGNLNSPGYAVHIYEIEYSN